MNLFVAFHKKNSCNQKSCCLQQYPIVLFDRMISETLFSSIPKTIITKQPYQKPIYKTYRELLQLDRPRKKIQYSSSEEEEDFLEKLMNEEKEKSNQNKKKKKDKRLPTKNSQSNADHKKTENMAIEDSKSKEKDNFKNSEKLSLNNKRIERQQSLQVNPESPIKDLKKKTEQGGQVKAAKAIIAMKQLSPKNQKKNQKFLFRSGKSLGALRGDVMLIDSKSKLMPAVEYISGDKMFKSVHSNKKSMAFHQLLKEKQSYQQTYRANAQLQSKKQHKHIDHQIMQCMESKFLYKPDITPINPNWRYNLTVSPDPFLPKRTFTDRASLFKSSEEQAIFVKSLGDYPRFSK